MKKLSILLISFLVALTTGVAQTPTIQSSNIVITGVTTTLVQFTLTPGNGNDQLIIMKAGSPVDMFPVDGVAYPENYNFNTGTHLGGGNYTAGVGITGSGSFANWGLGGLSPATLYYVHSIQANGTNYLTTSATGNPVSFTTLGVPTISSFTPTSGTVGSSVTITGTHFANTLAGNTVYFGATKATVTAATTTSLTVTVPAGATYSPITVLANNMVTYSTVPFMVSFGGSGISAGSFATKFDLPSTEPYAAALGDFDGDGKADLAVVNFSSNTASIFRNTSTPGTVSYAAKVDFATGTNPGQLVIADFNSDGKPDLAVANTTASSVSVLRNTSNGTGNIAFAVKIDLAVGNNPYWVAAGDADNDGKTDVFAINHSDNTVSVLRNTTTGPSTIVFDAKVDFATGSAPFAISVGDIDGDGKADMAVANYSSATVSVFRNMTNGIGNINFAAKSDFATSTDPQSICLGDLDGDGKLDIAVGNNTTNTVSVLRGTSTGPGTISFASRVDQTTGVNPRAVSIGDIDGDGKPDLATVNYSSGSLSVLRNISSGPGNINHEAAINLTTDTNPRGLAIGDIDGDGKPDLVAANAGGNTHYTFRNIITIPPPTITSFSPLSGPVGAPVTITGTNFDPTPANNVVYFGAVRASVTAATTTSLTVTTPAGATAQPIIVLTHGLLAYSGKAFQLSFPGEGIVSNTLAPFVDFASNEQAYHATLGDFDGDGKVDIALTNSNDNSISVLRNTTTVAGTITYATKVNYPTDQTPTGLVSGDFDGDGKTDLAAATFNATMISVFRNISSGAGNIGFAAQSDFATASTPQAVAVADFDGDGRLDIVSANRDANSVSVLRNTSTGSGSISFAAKLDFTTAANPKSVSVGDLDGNGKADLAVACPGGNAISVLRNTTTVAGTITFASKLDFAASMVENVGLGDIDGDGKLDMTVADYNATTVAVFLYNGTGPGHIGYAAKVPFPLGTRARVVEIADLDGDGKVDVALADNNILSVMRNIGSGPGNVNFAAYVEFPTGLLITSISAGDIDGDGKTDLTIANVLAAAASVFVNRGDVVLPTVSTYSPADNALGVQANTNLVLTFSEKVQKGTGNILIREGGVLKQTISVANANVTVNDNIVTIDPAAFGNGALVNIEIGQGAFKDFNNNDYDGIADPTAWNFTIIGGNGPSITSFNPAFGPKGTSVVITGTKFNATAANNTVYFGATKATVTAATTTQLMVTVPSGATYQPISVTTDGLTGFSARPFVITFANPYASFATTSFLRTNTAIGTLPASVAAADLDGDGFADLISSLLIGDQIAATRLTSTGFSGVLYNAPTALRPECVATADFDGDGKLDVATANTNSAGVSVLRNTSTSGAITLATPLNYSTLGTPTTVATGDFDGDGKIDVVTSNRNSTSGTLSVLRNTTVGASLSFEPKSDFSTGLSPRTVAVGDIDGDGFVDLVTANEVSNTVSVLRNTSASGVISFALKVDINVGTTPSAAAIGDVDGDGKADVVVTNLGGHNVSVLRNTSTVGSISFNTSAAPLSTGVDSSPRAVVLADLDGDGKVDIATANEQSSSVSVFRNTGTGAGTVSFATKVDYGSHSFATALCSGDFDGDGATDLIVANGNTNNVSLLRNIATSPSITSFDPINGVVGTAITITGVNFSTTAANNVVKFNGTTATITGTPTTTTIVTSVPTGATTGKITVEIDGQTATSVANFTVPTATSPTITSVAPGSGPIGTSVTITGTNFSTTPLSNTVKFNGTTATITGTPTATSIVTTVPTGATTGKITVEVAGQTAQSTADFTVTPPNSPTVSSFNPTSGPVGISVTITGTNYSTTAANNIVKFNGTTATITGTPTATSIVTTVPTGATTGKITVEVAGQTAQSTTDFTVTPPNSPTVSSFNPTSGPVGTSVTITGTNYSTTAANNIVKFNGTAATITGTPTATTIVTDVPAGATTGKITIEVAGQTATSATDFTVTAAGSASIVSESFPGTYDKGATLTISITVSNAANVNSVTLKSRGITEAVSALKSATLTASGNKFEKIFAATELTDPIGLTYFFEIQDKQPTPVTISSTTGKSYVKFPASATDQQLPGLSFGNQVSDYRIIAVPLVLTNPAVTAVFSSLMPYDKKKWRLFTYATGDNREYSTFSTIEPGKGYWLIVKTNTTINPGAGQAVQADNTTPFTINLAAGWNLIGNPYNFNVAWADVMAANSGVLSAATKPQVFLDGSLKDGTVLEKFRGAFVFADAAGALKIPVTKTLTGRIQDIVQNENPLDNEHWELRLNLRNGDLRNELGGIGMHPRATSAGKDDFDKVSVPLPDGLGLFELAYPHPELLTNFSMEVVPTQENYTWEFDVKRASDEGSLEMNWVNNHFGDNNKELKLFDPATLELIDMRGINRYVLSKRTKKLRILFGDAEYIRHALDKELPLLGSPYPNPAAGEVTIPFRVPETNESMNVRIRVYNSQGVEVAVPVDSSFGTGSYEARWNPERASGLYIVRMNVGQQETKTMKVIIN